MRKNKWRLVACFEFEIMQRTSNGVRVLDRCDDEAWWLPSRRVEALSDVEISAFFVNLSIVVGVAPAQ